MGIIYKREVVFLFSLSCFIISIENELIKGEKNDIYDPVKTNASITTLVMFDPLKIHINFIK